MRQVPTSLRASNARKGTIGTGPRFVAAALVGAFAALVVVALAAGAGRRGAARVTLQIAPRGLGNGLRRHQPGSTPQPTGHGLHQREGGQSCQPHLRPRPARHPDSHGDSGRVLSGWSNPDCAGTSPCTVDSRRRSHFGCRRLQPAAARGAAVEPGRRPCHDRARRARPCVQQPDDGGDQCFEFAPGTSVKVTMVPNPARTGSAAGTRAASRRTALTCTVI